MAEIEFTPEPEVATSVADDLNGALEVQIYLMGEYVRFNEAVGFYDDFQEELIKATTTAFRQIALIQKNITKQLKAEKPSVDVNSEESSN